ncbi:MAG: aspartate--tRNA ligase [Chlamydiales bacterium]|nr:aspartate--tRNA ligase [Chlamydiales bacterium]
MQTLDYLRSHNCGELNIHHIEKEITLSGWVQKRRDLGHLIFIDLRDRYGITQLVFNADQNPVLHKKAAALRSEFVVSISGTVIEREVKNPKMATGEIEIQVKDMQILSEAQTPPFAINDENLDVQETHRLKYRFLDIRSHKLQRNLILRHKAMLHVRNFMDRQHFIEVTTPILGKSTPEGARDYLVPSRIYPGSFYALPQSPQIFKQLLMVGGMDRYFQFATCFRDEDLRSDRQPEFMQIDIEMSFGKRQNIMQIAEGICRTIFSSCREIELPDTFPVMTHLDAMEYYGTDRPDTRFEMRLIRLDKIAMRSEFEVFKTQLKQGGCIKALCVKGGADLSRKEIDRYTAFVSDFGLKGLGWMKCTEEGLTSNIAKFFSSELLAEIQAAVFAKDGDLLFFAAENERVVNQSLDHLRRQIAKDRHLIHPEALSFTWVLDFPLFAWDENEQRIASEHHPFTAPHPEDLAYLQSDPLKVRSLAYDLVLNGYEIAGGSQRIHDSQLQHQIFSLLQLSQLDIEEKFGFFVEALQYGTPPHLGIAFGFDRIMMMICQTDNIRDVIAFPKTIKAADLMSQAPSKVAQNQLNDLMIKVIE